MTYADKANTVDRAERHARQRFPASFSKLIETSGRRRHLAAGQILVQPQDPFRNYFVVEDGMLRAQSPASQHVLLVAGDVFSANCADRCAMSIQALDATNVICIERRAVEERLATDAELSDFMRQMHARELDIIAAALHQQANPHRGPANAPAQPKTQPGTLGLQVAL